MLKMLRHKNVARTIFWGTLILILPAFVLWGTGNIGGGKGKGPKFAGTIDNRKISFEDFSASLASVRNQLTLNYFNQPEVLNALLNNKPLMAKLAWDRIIMVGEAKKSRVKVADAEVIGVIRNHPMFNRGGGFDDKVYEYVLRYNLGLSPRGFEEMVRQNLAIQKMNYLLTKDVTAVDEDAKTEFLKDNGRYKLSYVFFEQAGNEERKIAYDNAVGIYKSLADSMAKDKLSFEDAAGKTGLKVSQTPFMSRTEKIEEIGDAPMLAEILPVIKAGELSRPVPTEKGIILFEVTETEKLDEEKFAKAKEEYSKKALNAKKGAYIEAWLRGLEGKTTVNFDLNDYDKHLR